MEKCIPGNLVGHGKTLQEVRRPIALRRGKVRLKRAQVAEVSPISRKCRLCRARRANIAFIAQVSRCMHSMVDSTYNAICAFVRLLRIESLHRTEVSDQTINRTTACWSPCPTTGTLRWSPTRAAVSAHAEITPAACGDGAA
jgi:hypothetical protein